MSHSRSRLYRRLALVVVAALAVIAAACGSSSPSSSSGGSGGATATKPASDLTAWRDAHSATLMTLAEEFGTHGSEFSAAGESGSLSQVGQACASTLTTVEKAIALPAPPKYADQWNMALQMMKTGLMDCQSGVAAGNLQMVVDAVPKIGTGTEQLGNFFDKVGQEVT
jgi:hypothetical protein